MELRYYQAEAVEACYRWLGENDGNPVIILPTGAGKSAVASTICTDAVNLWNARVLVLSHVKELLEQLTATLRRMCPTINVGLYSAGLKSRELGKCVTVAGIQSVYNRAEELGRIEIVIIDEVHLVPPDGDGMYRTLLAALIERNPDVRVIGLTATPYRLSGGLIYGDGKLFSARCYEAGVKRLVKEGYLSKLVGKAALCEVDTSAIKIVRGEYEEGQAEQAFTDVISGAVVEVISRTVDRKSVLLFCQTVAHGQSVAARLRAELLGRESNAALELVAASNAFDMGEDPLTFHALPVVCDWLEENGHPFAALTEWLRRGRAVVGQIYGDTPSDERAELIAQFKAGTLRYLVNVGVLTTGFDAPNVDCVCLLRATASPGLYYQMVGRGFRLAEGKKSCAIIDFGQNIKRHGPVDEVIPTDKKGKGDGEAVTKTCPECRTVVLGGVSVCPDCGYQWPARDLEPKHDGRSDDTDPLSDDKPKKDSQEVYGVTYRPHTKKDAPPGHPKTLRVEYRTGIGATISEWICVEHPAGSFAHGKALQWWGKRCNYPMPETAAEAAMIGTHGLLANPIEVTTKTKPGEKYPSIEKVVVGDKPTFPTPCHECGAVNQNVLLSSSNIRLPGRIVCGMCNTHVADCVRETVEHYGTYNETQQAGLLPASMEFDEPGPTEFQEEPQEEEVPW